MSQEIIDKVRKECIGWSVFLYDQNPAKSFFGFDDHREMEIFDGIVRPCDTFSRFSFQYLSLPRPLKDLVKAPNDFNRRYDKYSSIHIFNYALNPRTTRKILEKMEDTDRWVFEQTGEYGGKSGLITADFYQKMLSDRFGDSINCLYTNKFTSTGILGSADFMRQLMDYLKAAPEEALVSIDRFFGFNHPELVRSESKKNVHIYDLVNEPKEVHYLR